MPDVINKVMSLLSGDNEPGSDRDVLLKQLTKEISQNKYAKFYKVRQGELDPSFAQYLYNVYRIIYPLQSFLKDTAKAAKIRQIALEAFLDKNVMDIIKRLSPEAIAERKKTAGANLPKQLEEDLTALIAGFDSPRIAAADKCFNLIAAMKQFVLFDFASLLRKFDPDMKEGDFILPPKFSALEGDVVSAELSALFAVLPPYDESNDWKTVFEILKYCKGGTDVIPFPQWTNLLISLEDFKTSKAMELINRLSSGNPILEIKPSIPNEALSSLWIEQKTNEVREVISGITGNQKNAQISALEKAIFGAVETRRLLFYTKEKGKSLADKALESYIYAPALNHLMAFIQDFFSKEIQELCDILLIRGKWTNTSLSLQMSEGYHNIIDITPEITKLDAALDEDGADGPRLRGALLRVDRDKSQARYINIIVNSVNEEALHIINRAVPSLIVVGKHFKLLLDDYDKKPFELIMNWKELSLMSKLPISQRIAAAYKKINYFVQLMMLEAKSLEE